MHCGGSVGELSSKPGGVDDPVSDVAAEPVICAAAHQQGRASGTGRDATDDRTVERNHLQFDRCSCCPPAPWRNCRWWQGSDLRIQIAQQPASRHVVVARSRSGLIRKRQRIQQRLGTWIAEHSDLAVDQRTAVFARDRNLVDVGVGGDVRD